MFVDLSSTKTNKNNYFSIIFVIDCPVNTGFYNLFVIFAVLFLLVFSTIFRRSVLYYYRITGAGAGLQPIGGGID